VRHRAAVARVQIAREHAPAAVHVRHDDAWHRAPPLRLDSSVPPAAINAPPRMTASRAFSTMTTWISLLALAAVCHGEYAPKSRRARRGAASNSLSLSLFLSLALGHWSGPGFFRF